jgi:mono/diheme cytochrome c family protein
MRSIDVSCVALSLLVLFACGGGAGGGEEAAAPGPQPFPITDEMLAKGQNTYKLNCVPCHGPQGKGDGPSAAGLNPPPRDHSNQSYMARLTDDMIAQTVQMGGAIRGYPNMPSSPHIRGEDMVALVAFVRRLSDPSVQKVDLTIAE